MRSVLVALRQERVPTIFVQHGIYFDSWLWNPVDITKICVDESFRDILIKRGEDPKKIIITGAPRYDILFRKTKEDKDSLKRRLGLNPDKKYLCLLTSFLPEWSTSESRKQLLSTVIKSAKAIGYDLVIKLHPQEGKSEIQGIVSKVAKTREIENSVTIFPFEEKELFDVILASEIVVGVRTSAFIAALLAKKPAILINFDPSVTDFYPGIENKIFGVARSHAELFEMIKDVVRDPSKARDSIKRAERYARKYSPYKNATTRIISCILDYLKNEDS
jgi:CDP-glycerol glycerophosphotransferase (TagB/SpsB family)